MEKNSNKKNGLLVSVIIGLLALVMLIVIGNVISIGDKIAGIHPGFAYLFYGVVIALFIWLVVLPVVRVIVTPPLKGIGRENITGYTPAEVTEYIKDLKSKIKLTKEEERELKISSDRKKTIENIFTGRREEMEKVVKNAAVSTFVITAISQNGSFDFISSVVINFRMINAIVKTLGKRPSYGQLIKLYISVISASLVITAIDDIFGDIDFSSLLGSLGGVTKALNIIIPSATNGLMNAFVTLRVGYATIKYLEVGNEDFDREEARQFALRSARKQLLGVGKAGIAEVAKKAGKMLKSVVE